MPLINPNEVVELFESCLRNPEDKDAVKVEGIVFDALLNVKGKKSRLSKCWMDYQIHSVNLVEVDVPF